jgi:hypothetical protein
MMKNKLTYFLAMLSISLGSCVKEIDFETETFESALVVEASLTNEEKKHEIKLSRSYRFEDDGPAPETNAIVKVVSANGDILFEETEAGKYVSMAAFRAMPNINYVLQIKTDDGRSYKSNKTNLTQSTQIDNLYAIRETNDNGVNGMSIYIDTFDPTGNSSYYRYEYDETYKIIAPKWVDRDLEVVADVWPDCEVRFVPRPDTRVCYNTISSIDNIQGSTAGLSEDRLTRFLVRKISSENYIISWRYSILIRQYVQSIEAYTYFETLSEYAGDGSLFLQNQPGFISSNVESQSNAQEKVLGFFEVSSVSSKRIFFSYDDFYPNEPQPPYTVSCNELSFKIDLGHPDDLCGPLLGLIDSGDVLFYRENEIPSPNEGPYYTVATECGDCTRLGITSVPDFWED